LKVNEHFLSTRRFKLSKWLSRPAETTSSGPIAAALCAFVFLLSAPVSTESGNFRRSTSPQSQLVSIGILSFQDESGMNAPADLGQKIAKDLQQKLAVNYKDTLPRMLNAGLDPAVVAPLNVEQAVTLGKQNGVKFVVRGGLLAVTTENAGEETKIGVQLYASITSVESASDNNVRAEGSGTQKGPVAEISSVDLKSAVFRDSAWGQALSAATAQLASSIHNAIATSAATTAPTETLTPDSSAETAETEAAQAAASDQELQQLVAQADATLAGNPNSSTENINALRQALEGLKTALAAKASRLQENKDTGEADQEIAGRKQEMQAALAKLTAEASAGNTAAQIQQPSDEKKSLLARIGDFAGEATNLLQKIQELRATLRGVREDQSANQDSPQDQTSPQGPGTQTNPPVERMTGEVTGVVTEDGNPVEGAIVTTQEGGASAATDNSGIYILKGLTPGSLIQLTVTKDGQLIAKGQVDVLSGRAAIADFQTTATPGGRFPVIAMPGVLTSTIVGNRARNPGLGTGTLKGVVSDATGRPVPFALVRVPGVGMARTNAQGQYLFVNAPVGVHQITVHQSGMKPKSSQVTVAAQTSVESRTLFAAADTLARSRQSLIQANAGTVLRGTVVDNQTHPLAGAKISVIQSETTVSVLTAPNGTFELRNLKLGSYTVSAYKVGYLVASQAVTLKATGTEQRNFQLNRQTSAAVNKLIKNAIVSQGEVRGILRTQTGAPIANASIEVRPAGRAFLTARALTNSNGEYALRLAAGSYDLRARQQSFQDGASTVAVRAGSATRADFELRQTRTSTAVTGGGNTIRQPETRRGQLAGRVTDGNGKAIAGAIIALASQRRAITDQEGNYSVAELSPDSYRITVVKAGFAGEEKTINVRAGSSTRQDFVLRSAGSAVRGVGSLTTAGIVRARSGQVAGRVVDGKTGAPIAGVTLSITGQRTITTGADGSYTFTNIPPGTYQVAARKSGFTEAQKSVTIRGAEIVSANFALTSMLLRPVPILRRP
jgi:flagellar biosynthesis/type III secretory pathway chaperone